MSPKSNTLELQVRPASVEKLLAPRSIAIVGVSTNPGSPGNAILNNLIRFHYTGDIFLVSRNRSDVDGRPCLLTIDDLPEGVDSVVLCVPQSAVVDSVKACARRRAGSVMIFAAGFAEMGEEGKRAQKELTDIGLKHNMVIAGPNCMGLTNFVHNVPLTFAPGLKKTKIKHHNSLCVLAQSGGMMSNLREIAQARGISMSHAISTGNEAIAGVEDYLAYLLDDQETKVIAMYVEQIRRPKLFLELATKARQRKKTIVLLHPGKSEASREAAQSHTGSLVGDYTVIKTLLEFEAVIMVETIEELVDVSWFLTRYDSPPTEGTAILTDSGAVKGFALDYCETVGLDLPEITESTTESIVEYLPGFTQASNPLDMTAQGLSDFSLYTKCSSALLNDHRIGSLMIVVLPGSPSIGLAKGRAAIKAINQSTKPAAFVVMGEGSPLSEELIQELKEHDIPFFRSPERAIRTLSTLTKYGNSLKKTENQLDQSKQKIIPLHGQGVITEYKAKEFFAKIGIPVPKGALANEVNEAVEIARRIGYPIVLKAQANDLAHKSDIGGVLIDIQNEIELRKAWSLLYNNIKTARPDLVLDGILVEKMGEQGIEMVVGGRRDSEWGPIVMVGLGGIWIEVLKDVRFLSPKLSERLIEEEIVSLKSVDLLRGARGKNPADIKALTKVVEKVSNIMTQYPNIDEIDINPVMVYPEGKGIIALDALIVTSSN